MTAELARTDEERTVGLSGRHAVPAGTGMVFRFGATAPETFWMRDTLVPLDVAWVRAGRLLGVTVMVPCRTSDPAGCPVYPSPGSIDTAIEAPTGSFAGAAKGSAVAIS